MQNNNHWAEIKEAKGGYYGTKILLFIYRFGGKYLFKLCLFPVICFFYIFHEQSRNNSKFFLKQVIIQREKLNLEKIDLSSFHHFMSFAQMISDKINSWKTPLICDKDYVLLGETKKCLFNCKKGKIFLCSHLGNFESLRSISIEHKDSVSTVNSVVFTDNAQHINNLIKSISKNASLNLIPAQDFDATTALILKEKIDNHEIVAIVGDRIPIKKGRGDDFRTVKVKFLDHQVSLPQGPFVLASILKCPVQLLIGVKNEKTNRLDVYCKDLFDEVKLSRKNRAEDIQKYAQVYAKELEYYAIRYPYQWFNFHNFFE